MRKVFKMGMNQVVINVIVQEILGENPDTALCLAKPLGIQSRMSQPTIKRKVGKYEIGRTIGEGTFAKVKFARNSDTGQPVAIKILDKDKVLKHKMAEQIKREIATMKLIKHPYVVRIHEVLGSKTKIFIVLEFVTGGELFDKIVNNGRMREAEARKYFQQLINAVDYCHSRGVFHRDLKPENLLLDAAGNLKISDFGLSALSRQVRDDGLLHTACGTPNYVAPEVLNDQGYDGATADLWSCGVILFVLLAGYLPFDDSNLAILYKKISSAEFRCPPWISFSAMKLITRILEPNPEKGHFLSLMANDAEEINSESPSEDRVDKYNAEAAEILVNEAQRLPLSDAVPVYEQLLSTFPTSAKYWKQYVEAYMAVNNDEATRQVFSRCLLSCLQVPLWRCYIRFIRKVNDKKGIEGQEETKKAFEFMLNYVGADISAGPVWMEYIAYLKSLPAQSTLEESQRMTTIRKTYQRAIVMPTHHVEQLWRDYENFENSVSRALAKGLLAEYQPKYNSARAVYRERKNYFDEIDWNMLAVPPSGSAKEEAQWMAWRKLLCFEKGNPQRIDNASANKRIAFAYEQCLMYLYHYPDIWYEYAMWQAKSGSRDSAIKVFQRALKALPESEMLKYAFAELEESHGAPQAAKRVYEGLLGDGVNATALSHIQFMRFLRRTEGVEAARKYFLDARKSPKCTYHVYVAYAMMAFCLDKDVKLAHNIFEAGLKRFMHEPSYILEYADFLCRLNDDRNIRALFERALSSLPPNKSVEVWKRFAQFEQTYGDLSSMLKVDQRRKEALCRMGENGESTLEESLQDVISRYSFMDLWPCSSKDLDNLARQEWLSRNANKKIDNPVPAHGAGSADRNMSGATSSSVSGKIVFPDVSKMVIYNPIQKPGHHVPPSLSGVSSTLSNGVTVSGGGTTTAISDLLKTLPPPLANFAQNLPAVEGPSPDVDFVISICLQSNIPTAIGKSGASQQMTQPGHAPSTSDLSGSSKFKQTRNRPGKRKDSDRQDDDDTSTVQSQPQPRDAFKIRQLQKARATSSSRTGGSTSYGSGFSGDFSGSSS